MQMSNQPGMSKLLAASVLSAAVAAGITYLAVKPQDPESAKAQQARDQEKLQSRNEKAVDKTVTNPLLARQFKKSNVIVKPQVLDSGETAIAMSRSGNSYIVVEPNDFRSSRNVHYTAWKYMVFKDEMRGTVSRTATIGNLIEYTGNMSEPFMLTLNIRCEDSDNRCEMYFGSQFAFDPIVTGIVNRTEFNIQLDDRNLEKFALDLGDKYQYAIAQNNLYRYLYDNLASAKKLRVELWSGGNAQVEFDLSGFDWKKFNALTFETSSSKVKM